MKLPFMLAALLILLLNVLFGLLRGVKRGAVRTGTLLVAAVVAFFAASGVASLLADTFAPMLEDALSSNEAFRDFVAVNPEAPSLIVALAEMLIAPILFLLCYMILKFFTWIIYIIICAVFKIRKPGKEKDESTGEEKKVKRGWGSYLGGAALGLVAGCIGLAVFVTPVIGYTDLANRAITQLEDSMSAVDGEEDELQELNENYLKQVAEAPIASLAFKMIGDPLFESLTTTEWNGGDTSLEAELFAILGIVDEASKLTENEVEAYGEAESKAVHAMIGNVGKSRILTYLGGNTLSGMATAWLDGKTFFGIDAPGMGDANAQLIVNGLLRVFSTTNPELFAEDLAFFANLFDLLVEYEMFTVFSEGTSENAFVEQMVSSGFLDAASELLKSTPRMKPVLVAIGDVGMNIMIEQLGLPEEYRENHAQLMDDMSTALQEAVNDEGVINVEQLHSGLNEAFADSGVEIPESAAEVIATGLSQEFTPEELKTLTLEQITDRLIDRFSSVEDIDELANMIPGGLPEGLPENLPEGIK